MQTGNMGEQKDYRIVHAAGRLGGGGVKASGDRPEAKVFGCSAGLGVGTPISFGEKKRIARRAGSIIPPLQAKRRGRGASDPKSWAFPRFCV